MNNKLKVLLSSLIIGLPLMIGFQNCAKTQGFEMTDVSNGIYKQNGLDSNQLPPDNTVDVQQPGSLPPVQQPVAEEPVSQPPAPPADDNMNAGSGSEDSNSAMPPAAEQPASQPPVAAEEPKAEPPSSADSKKEEEKDDNHDVSYQVEDPEMEDAQDIEEAKYDCAHISESSNENAGAKFTENSVSGIRGKKVISSADFAGRNNIESISNSYGKLYVCGLNVKNISKSGGKLILIGSHIENISSFHGKVHVVDKK